MPITRSCNWHTLLLSLVPYLEVCANSLLKAHTVCANNLYHYQYINRNRYFIGWQSDASAKRFAAACFSSMKGDKSCEVKFKAVWSGSVFALMDARYVLLRKGHKKMTDWSEFGKPVLGLGRLEHILGHILISKES